MHHIQLHSSSHEDRDTYELAMNLRFLVHIVADLHQPFHTSSFQDCIPIDPIFL